MKRILSTILGILLFLSSYNFSFASNKMDIEDFNLIVKEDNLSPIMMHKSWPQENEIYKKDTQNELTININEYLEGDSAIFFEEENKLADEDINVIAKPENIIDMDEFEDIYDIPKSLQLEKNHDMNINNDMELMAVDRDLWNQNYNNVGSIKKNINATNYAYPYDNGTVKVTIKNTGSTALEVNIYKSWWNSETISYGTIQPGSSRIFIVGPEHGTNDCNANNCFGKHDFTVSVYSVQGPVSFSGKARIYY